MTPNSPETGGAVYTSARGLRYHATQNCTALATGLTLRGTRQLPQPTDLHHAKEAGKSPCRTCYRTDLHELIPTKTDYGHHPVPASMLSNSYSPWSNCNTCRTGTTPHVCARCLEFDTNGLWRDPTHPVHWPCATAHILGLTRQDAAQ